jgi:D-beta-D-heptose 7-phosphate kinase/D-beta-D-heptose 1-phosphate adenosyltransferase
MLDIYYKSIINRKAPEADIPIYNILDINYILGGSANIAYNLYNLEKNIELISVIGEDIYGEKVKDILNSKGISHCLFVDSERKTTQKNRIINNNKIKVRYDIEHTNEISNNFENKILDYIKSQRNIEGIIISDYDKGVITEKLAQEIINYSNENNIYTFIDPKIKNYLKYKNCFLFKPNLHEAIKISGNENIEIILDDIKKKIECKNILLTCGKEGMYLNKLDNYVNHNNLIEPVDVTGAGDIVLTIFSYIYLQYKDLNLSLKISNYIAGKSIKTIGNYEISNKDILEFFELNNKIIYENEFDKILKLSNKNNIVFTNGCFDIIHSAHIKLASS